MNILIIGEFSAFAKHLKSGFQELGHNVSIVQDGDGYKNIELDTDDISSVPLKMSICGRKIPGSRLFLSAISNWDIKKKIRKRFQGEKIDIAVIVNYRFLSDSFFVVGVKCSYLKKLKKGGARIIMSACGSDPAMRVTYPDYFNIWEVRQPDQDSRYTFLLKNGDVVIPTIYSYYNAVQNYCKWIGLTNVNISNPIPLPIKVEKSIIIKKCNNRKIVIFHGVNRPKEKGTAFIKEAMDMIAAEFPEKVECICKGGIPYAEYIKLFEDIDILIDQTYNNGWGVNAAMGAMNGKCVLAPCGKENEQLMHIPSIPFVYIEPNSRQIYEVLKDLVSHPDKIYDIKLKSRSFIEKYCASSTIAQQYIELALK